ncbi:hypothetical protein CHELA20_50354 [Hyphomicrobiales bacterium]|nr:hypothetical protein CHELA20_50354 [Hyphomicrobiales bacterium]
MLKISLSVSSRRNSGRSSPKRHELGRSTTSAFISGVWLGDILFITLGLLRDLAHANAPRSLEANANIDLQTLGIADNFASAAPSPHISRPIKDRDRHPCALIDMTSSCLILELGRLNTA